MQKTAIYVRQQEHMKHSPLSTFAFPGTPALVLLFLSCSGTPECQQNDCPWKKIKETGHKQILVSQTDLHCISTDCPQNLVILPLDCQAHLSVLSSSRQNTEHFILCVLRIMYDASYSSSSTNWNCSFLLSQRWQECNPLNPNCFQSLCMVQMQILHLTAHKEARHHVNLKLQGLGSQFYKTINNILFSLTKQTEAIMENMCSTILF